MSLVTKTIDSRILGKEMNLDNSRGINSAGLYREVKSKYGDVHKGRYEDYLLDELIPFVDNTFHTIPDRSARKNNDIIQNNFLESVDPYATS